MAATRAKDSDREDTCKILDAALEDGELSTEEHRERVSSATAAITLADLHALVADLQPSSSPVRLQPLPTAPKSGRLGIAALRWRLRCCWAWASGGGCTATQLAAEGPCRC
ncbi:MAG TPA: DUF1707 domain-containing protein [Mycobacterium sp.]|nr:DUF1707 domain-containing protein [Mycobacterium sp.]